MILTPIAGDVLLLPCQGITSREIERLTDLLQDRFGKGVTVGFLPGPFQPVIIRPLSEDKDK